MNADVQAQLQANKEAYANQLISKKTFLKCWRNIMEEAGFDVESDEEPPTPPQIKPGRAGGSPASRRVVKAEGQEKKERLSWREPPLGCATLLATGLKTKAAAMAALQEAGFDKDPRARDPPVGAGDGRSRCLKLCTQHVDCTKLAQWVLTTDTEGKPSYKVLEEGTGSHATEEAEQSWTAQKVCPLPPYPHTSHSLTPSFPHTPRPSRDGLWCCRPSRSRWWRRPHRHVSRLLLLKLKMPHQTPTQMPPR